MIDDPDLPLERMVLEEGVPLSRSRLWQLHRDFFAARGLSAWRDGTVPSYVTTNPYLARTYARLVFAWLRDLTAAGAALPEPDQPIYVVELGAGSGRFAFHFLRAFFGFFDRSTLRALKVVYVMTDFSARTIEAWRAQPQLRLEVDAGRLDFARFDGEGDRGLTLLNSERTLEPGLPANPMAFIANYFFDGLVQDVFHVHRGVLSEGLVRLSMPAERFEPHDGIERSRRSGQADVAESRDEVDLGEISERVTKDRDVVGAPEHLPFELLDRIDVDYALNPIDGTCYDDPTFNAQLEAYRRRLVNSWLLFPIGPLRCLRALRALAGDRLLLLSADKGYHREEDLLFRGPPRFSRHGSISWMVNYHALGGYTEREGGLFLGTDHGHDSLDVCVLAFGSTPGGYLETRQAFEAEVGEAGPDDFYALKTFVDARSGELSVAQMMALMRISGWDSRIFLDFVPALLERLERMSDPVRGELAHAARQVWDHHFDIGEAGDLAFVQGLLYFGMEYYPEAIERFRCSIERRGADPATWYDIAMCRLRMAQREGALEALEQALDVDPGFEPALSLRLQLETGLRWRGHLAVESPPAPDGGRAPGGGGKPAVGLGADGTMACLTAGNLRKAGEPDGERRGTTGNIGYVDPEKTRTRLPRHLLLGASFEGAIRPDLARPVGAADCLYDGESGGTAAGLEPDADARTAGLEAGADAGTTGLEAGAGALVSGLEAGAAAAPGPLRR